MTPVLARIEEAVRQGSRAVEQLLAWANGKPVDVINTEAIGKKK